MLFPVRNLSSRGVVSPEDFPPQDQPPQGVTRASNVAFRDGKVLKISGWDTTLDAANEVAANFELYGFGSWSDSNGIFTAFGASDGVTSKIYVTDDGVTLVEAVTENLVPAPVVLGPSTTWQFEVFGRFLIANNGVDPPMYSESYAVGVWTFQIIPGWGAADSPGGAVRSIRSYKNYLIAIGLDDTPYTVYWSDLGSVEDMPTSWDYVDTTSQAGRNPLEAHDGDLVDGEHLNDRLVLFQEGACTSLEYVGGSGVFSFRRLFGHGLVNVGAVVTMEGTQLFVDSDAIHIHDGSRIESPADERVQTQYANEVSDTTKVFCAKDNACREVLIFYPTEGATYPNKALIYSWATGTWTFEDFDEEIRDMKESSIPASVTAWAELTLSWGALAGTWASFSETARQDVLYQLGALLWSRRGSSYTRPGDNLRRTSLNVSPPDIRVLSTGVERSISGLVDTDYFAFIERTYVDLDEVTQNNAQVKHLRAVHPQITGTGLVDFQFGVSRTTFDPVTWGPIKVLDLDTELSRRKIDLRQTGRYLHWRVGSWDGIPNTGNWELSGIDLDIQMQGTR